MKRMFLAGSALLGVVLFLPAAVAAAPSTATEIDVSFVVDEVTPVAGQLTDYTAALQAQGAPLPGETMTLLARSFGGSTYVPVGQAVTDAQGQVHATARLVHSSAIKWAFAGDGSHLPSQSTPYLRAIASQVTARVRIHTVRPGQRLVVHGLTSPAKPGNRVTLWRGQIPRSLVQNGAPAPVLIGEAVVGPDGRYRVSAVFSHVGRRLLFVRISRGGANAPGFSNYVRIRVG